MKLPKNWNTPHRTTYRQENQRTEIVSEHIIKTYQALYNTLYLRVFNGKLRMTREQELSNNFKSPGNSRKHIIVQPIIGIRCE